MVPKKFIELSINLDPNPNPWKFSSTKSVQIFFSFSSFFNADIAIYKEHIEKMFVDSFNKLLKNKDEIINNCREFVKSIDDTQALETKKARLCGESRLLYTKIQNYIDKNATETLNQNIYKEHYNTLSDEYEEIKQKIENIDTKLKNKRAKLLSIEKFLNEISEMENLIDTFDEKLFTSVVDKIIVKSYTQAATIFRNGQELSLNLEEYK